MYAEWIKNKRKELNVKASLLPDSGGRDRIRELVRIRDKHTCQECKRKWKVGTRRFDVHHQDEKEEGKSHERGCCERDQKSFDRMITLCHSCHLNLDSVIRKMSVAQLKSYAKRKKTLSTQ